MPLSVSFVLPYALDSVFEVIEDMLLRRIVRLESYSEESWDEETECNGISLSLFPKLRVDQCRHTSHLKICGHYDYNESFAFREEDESILHLPHLQTLHIRLGQEADLQGIMSDITARNLKVLVVIEAQPCYWVSWARLSGDLSKYPNLCELALDVDLNDLEVNPNVSMGRITKLALGGRGLFLNEDENDGEPISLDISQITKLFPNLSSLTLKEVSMMGCGVVHSSASRIQELILLNNDQLIFDTPNDDHSGDIRRLLRSVPDLRVIQIGRSQQASSNAYHAMQIQHDNENHAQGLYLSVISVLSECDRRSVARSHTCPMLEELRCIGIVMDHDFLEVLRSLFEARDWLRRSSRVASDPLKLTVTDCLLQCVG